MFLSILLDSAGLQYGAMSAHGLVRLGNNSHHMIVILH